MQGGFPIVVDSEAIGAIGASFVTPEPDVQIAQTGSAAGPHLIKHAAALNFRV
jgi:glc operon protein GlcG